MNEGARKLIYGAFLYGGGFHLQSWRCRAAGRRLTIVNLHRVDDRAAEDPTSLPTLFISLSRFDGMLEFLKQHYRLVSLDRVKAAISGGEELPQDACHVTFDDAYQDVFDHGLPRLKRAGIPATVFVPTDFVSGRRDAFWWDECYYLLRMAWDRRENGFSMEQARSIDDGLAAHWEPLQRCDSLAAANRQCVECIHDLQAVGDNRRREWLDGLWRLLAPDRERFLAANRVASWDTVRSAVAEGFSIGSHTCSHCFFDSEPEETVRAELSASKQEIERQLGYPVDVFAYPGGKITDSTQELVAGAGYSLGMTTARGVNRDEEPPMLLKRVSLWNGSASGGGEVFSKARLAFNLRRRIG